MIAPKRAHSTARGAVEGVDLDGRISGRHSQPDAPRPAADVEHARVGGDIDGIEEMAGTGIDAPMGEDPGAGQALQESAAVAEHDLAGEVADLRRLARLLDKIRDRLRARPDADSLPGGGELLMEPAVAGVVGGDNEPATAAELDKGLLEQIAGQFRLAAGSGGEDDQIVGTSRHVGSTDEPGKACRWRSGRLSFGDVVEGQIVLEEVEEPDGDVRRGAFGGQGSPGLGPPAGRAEDPLAGEVAGDGEGMGLGGAGGSGA